MAEEPKQLKPIGNVVSANPAKLLPSSQRLEKAETMAIFARRLFDFYHEQELAANPEVFLAGVVDLFCNYPVELVRKAVSPAFGLPCKHKFPPRLAEIKEFLDEHTLTSEPAQRYPVLPPDPPLPKFEPKPQHKTYADFLLMVQRGEIKQRPIGYFEK